MAKFEFKGVSELIKELEKAGKASKPACEAAVYAGAGYVADEIKKAIRDLDQVKDVEAMNAWKKREPSLISIRQKKGLIESLGIASFTNKYGVISTKIGFDGYNDVITNQWPNGQPNALIARACESGSTAMIKQPFVRPTEKRIKERTEQIMIDAADKKMQEILGGNNNG